MIDYEMLIDDIKRVENHCIETDSLAAITINFNSGKGCLAHFAYTVLLDGLIFPKVYSDD